MRLAASSCNPAWHKSSTIVSNYLLCSCHNAVRNLQLQSRIAGVYCPQPCQCVLSQPVEQERRTKSTSVRAALTMGTISRCSDSLTFWRFLCESELWPKSGAHFVDLIFQKCSGSSFLFTFWNAKRPLATVSWKKLPTSHLPKVLRTCIFSQFGVKIELSLTVLCTFRRQLSQIEARNRGNRDPTSATPGATLPDKTQGFAPESVFTRVLTRDDMMLTRGLPDDDKTAPGHSSVTRKYSN